MEIYFSIIGVGFIIFLVSVTNLINAIYPTEGTGKSAAQIIRCFPIVLRQSFVEYGLTVWILLCLPVIIASDILLVIYLLFCHYPIYVIRWFLFLRIRWRA